MFDEILGLPAHPLIIHTAVILIPLLAVGSVVYGVVPRFRPFLSWAVVLLALAAPATAFAAKESGEAFEHRLFPDGLPTGEVGQRINEHSGYANPVFLTAVGLGVAALLLVYSSRRLGKVTTWALSAVTLVLAVAAGYYVFQAGHSGATAVWAQ